MWLPQCVLLVLLAISAAEQQFQHQRPLSQPRRQTKDDNPIIFEDAFNRAREQARSSSPNSQVGYPTNQPTNNQGQGETGYQEEDVLTKKLEENQPSFTRTQNNGQGYQPTNPQADTYFQQNPLTAKRPTPPPANTQNGQEYQTTYTQNGQAYQQPNPQADHYNQQNPLTAKRPQPQPGGTQDSQGYQQPSRQADPYNQQNPLTAKRPTPHPINTQDNQGYQQPSKQADPYNQQNPLTAKRPTPHPINNQEYQPSTNTQNGQAYQPPKPQSNPYNPPNPLTSKRPMPQPINTNSQGYQPSNALGQNQGQGYQPNQNSQSYPQTNTQFQRKPSFNQQINYTKQFSTDDQYEEERGEVKKYDRCQVWNVIIDDDKSKLNVVGGLTRVQELTSWGGNHTAVDFLVKPENQMHVGAILRRSNIKYSVVISDLQKNIDNENPPLSEEDQELQDRKGHRMTWQQYHRLADIYGYLDYLAITYPNICDVRSIGRSHEGREIKMLRISNGRPNNKAVLIDGGIHAREWISPATVTYMINEIVENFDDESATVRNMDWYIVPVLNPDGYEYTHTFDRLWRKNRRRFGTCSGVDLNRNFGYRWGGQGTSKNPCSEVYPGSQAFSEPESKALSDFVRLSPAKFKLYATYHSYGEYILYPWGYDKVVPEDYKELDSVANDAAQAIINKGGPKYKVGASSLVLYPASGGSDDWAKAIGKIKYTYTVELSDSGRFGFVLPAAYITKVAKESLAALRVMAEAAISA